jgi:hypothetical protein
LSAAAELIKLELGWKIYMIFDMLLTPKCTFSVYKGFNHIRPSRSCFSGQNRMVKVFPRLWMCDWSVFEELVSLFIGNCVTDHLRQISKRSSSFPPLEGKPGDSGHTDFRMESRL